MAKKVKKTVKPTPKTAPKPAAKKPAVVSNVQNKKPTSKKKYYKPKQVKKPIVKQEPKKVVEPMTVSLNESLPPVIELTTCYSNKKMCKTCCLFILFLLVFCLVLMF